jgi:hypothetical protein
VKRREENSGLIDLDALLKQAEAMPTSQAAPAPAKVSAPPVAAPALAPVAARLPVGPAAPAPVATRAPVAQAAPLAMSAPVRVAVALRADDSLEGVAAGSASTTARSPLALAAAPLPRSPASSRRRYAVLAGVVAAALAALAVVRVAHAPGTQPTRSVTAAAPAPLTPPLAQPIRPSQPATDAIDPSSLPVAATEPAAATPTRAALARTTALARAMPAPAAAEPLARVTAADLTAAAGSEPGDLGHAMRSAVGPRAEEKATTESSAVRGARQLRPSPGAVVGAIGSVLPAARACLGPDAAVRNGSLVFRSEGTVARVDLNGAKPEDACVRAALARARVEPFADDTFTTRVTVRP